MASFRPPPPAGDLVPAGERGALRSYRGSDSPHAERIFKPYAITEKVIFCITRNADIAPAEEGFEEDFRTQMKKLLRQRTKLAPVRLELSCPISNHFIQYFCEKLQLGEKAALCHLFPHANA